MHVLNLQLLYFYYTYIMQMNILLRILIIQFRLYAFLWNYQCQLGYFCEKVLVRNALFNVAQLQRYGQKFYNYFNSFMKENFIRPLITHVLLYAFLQDLYRQLDYFRAMYLVCNASFYVNCSQFYDRKCCNQVSTL